MEAKRSVARRGIAWLCLLALISGQQVRVVRDLNAAPPREVSGVGHVRAVQIWLPPQRARRIRAR